MLATDARSIVKPQCVNSSVFHITKRLWLRCRRVPKRITPNTNPNAEPNPNPNPEPNPKPNLNPNPNPPNILFFYRNSVTTIRHRNHIVTKTHH